MSPQQPHLNPKVPPPGHLPICQVEKWLKSRGVNYLQRVIDVPVGNFDKKKSRLNQARPQPIIPESVDRFALSFKAHGYDKAFPIVAYRENEKSTTFIIIDGNNRHAAAERAGLATVPTIVLASDTPPEKILLLTVEANAHHGVTPPEEWRIKQALNLLAVGNLTMEEICEAAAITEATLKTHKRVSEFDARARLLKISGWADLGVTIRYKLGQIQNDSVFFAAACMAISTEMTINDVTLLVRALKPMHSEEEQRLYVAGQAEERKVMIAQRREQARRNKQIRAGVKQSLVSALGKLMAVDEGALMRVAITDVERQELKRRLEAGAEKILSLQVALEQVMKGATA